MIAPINSVVIPRKSGIAHGFFTRSGGVSEGIYRSLNCGLGSKDDCNTVVTNRAAVAQYLGVRPQNLITANQIHSNKAVAVAAPWPTGARPDADAIVTSTPGLAIAVLTADCAPILFADPEAKVIACAHAGWRGALEGIIASTIAAMLTQGARREHIRATLGPCIGPTAYEVGAEFKAAFVARDRSHQQYFSVPDKSSSSTDKSAREHFDLPAFVLARLKAEQIGGIESQSRCTYANADEFFSYRRATHLGETDYGRQISAIVVT